MRRRKSSVLVLGALGVVFGDIGTSPLYALREAFHGAHAIPITHENVLGVLSLVVWALILIISMKYLLFVMRADNRGEGGVLTLTALAAPPRLVHLSRVNFVALLLGLFGASLLFGDGVITPAISVLSAIEGLEVATPFFGPYVIPLTLIVLAILFLAQHYGTARIGAVFGPIILVWFLALASLGVYGIIQSPVVLTALIPIHAVQFFLNNGWDGFGVLGAVFLAVTGGEALYADMGHFGRKPIDGLVSRRLSGVALETVSGQGALILQDPSMASNPFYKLAPTWALYPMVILATLATVIASQALISGVYSLTRQAIQMGYWPRSRIVHTSSDEIGQIYVPQVNWALLIFTCWIVLEFRSSSALASAYGIAVSTTMVITTLLACLVAYQRWRWSGWLVLVLLVFFVTIDLIFFSANLMKIADGGWVPLTMGLVVFICMKTWRRGRQILALRLKEKTISVADFFKRIEKERPVRVSGIGIFMTGDPDGVPPALLHNLKHNKALHERNVLITVTTEEVPHIPKVDRVEIQELKTGFYRVSAYYGFMETPDIRDVLDACRAGGLDMNLSEISFFLGRETLIPTARPGMAIWREYLFALMSRNAERATAYFNIPADQVVEMGIQVEL